MKRKRRLRQFKRRLTIIFLESSVSIFHSFCSLLAFNCSLYFYLYTQLKPILKAKIKSSDECSKTSWMNYSFSHWFLTSTHAVSIYTVHSLHELTAYTEVCLYMFLPCPVRATCPAHLNLLDLICLIIPGDEYKIVNSPLCNFFHSPVTSSLLGPIDEISHAKYMTFTLHDTDVCPRPCWYFLW
jgi:hypothetical protein